MLRAEPVQLVGVGISARTGIKWNLDFLVRFLRNLDCSIGLPRLNHGMVHDKRTLSLLRQNVVEVGVHLEIGIRHGGGEQLFLFRRKVSRDVAVLVHRAEHVEQVGESMQEAARVEIAKSKHAAIGAAGIVREDRLESRMPLSGGAPLLPRVA